MAFFYVCRSNTSLSVFSWSARVNTDLKSKNKNVPQPSDKVSRCKGNDYPVRLWLNVLSCQEWWSVTAHNSAVWNTKRWTLCSHDPADFSWQYEGMCLLLGCFKHLCVRWNDGYSVTTDRRPDSASFLFRSKLFFNLWLCWILFPDSYTLSLCVSSVPSVWKPAFEHKLKKLCACPLSAL